MERLFSSPSKTWVRIPLTVVESSGPDQAIVLFLVSIVHRRHAGEARAEHRGIGNRLWARLHVQQAPGASRGSAQAKVGRGYIGPSRRRAGLGS